MKDNEEGSNANLLNAKEASEFLGIKLSTLYQLTSKQKLPFYKPTGGKLSFIKSDLLSWVKSHKVETTEELTQKNMKKWKEG